MKENRHEEGRGDSSWQSPEIRVFTLGVEAGFCQSGQINDVRYLDTYEW